MIRKRTASDGSTRYVPEVWDPRADKRVGANKLLGAPGTYTTMKDARRVERRMHDAIEDLRDTPTDVLTVAQWVDRWLAEYPRPKVNSRAAYKRALVPLKKSDYANVPLHQFKRSMAREIAIEYPNTARVAHTAWQDAMLEAEIVAFNPWARLKIPQRGRRTLALTEAEVYELAGYSTQALGPYGSVMEPLIVFAAYTGLRLGEIAAMRWDWIDGETVWVRANRGRDGLEDAPKHRKLSDPPQPVALFAPAADALARIPRSLTGYVWTGPMGRPLNHAAFNGMWQRVRLAFLLADRDRARQVEIEAKSNGKQHDLCFHTLRHSCASIMAERGFSRLEIALQLRHRDPSVSDIYTHILDERRTRLSMVDRFGSERRETVARRVASAD